jgi:hypothetical protein
VIPNSFTEPTSIGFILSDSCNAQLRTFTFDINGKLVTEMSKSYPIDHQLETFDLKGQSGILYYKSTTPFGILTNSHCN